LINRNDSMNQRLYAQQCQNANGVFKRGVGENNLVAGQAAQQMPHLRVRQHLFMKLRQNMGVL